MIRISQEIIQGDCLDIMRTMADNSVDFIITDSPYGISFMNKEWDKGIPSIEYWKEMLRIVKPGGHLLAAGLPRMMHRLICTIEDSGWQVRDMLMHLFGSGFPKSHNNFGLEGYGTALKPAWEGWTLCMKPCEGTFAQNAEKWGVSGINIDESRIPTKEILSIGAANLGYQGTNSPKCYGQHIEGRWPANIILDEESAEQLDQMTGNLKSGHRNRQNHKSATENLSTKVTNLGTMKKISNFDDYNDSGGASRFFYVAKASSKERQGSKHPTIKPKKLISYLVKLLSPPGNPICLDPFMGSGTTGVVCKELGIRFIGIELDPEYFEDAKRRINLACVPQYDLFDLDKQDSQ